MWGRRKHGFITDLLTTKAKPGHSTPPPWIGWLSPATGLAALIISCVGAAISWQSYSVNKSNRADLITPRLAVTEMSLIHPRGELSDLAVVSYQIKNFGTLTARDVHTQLNYTYAEAPLDPRLLPPVGTSNEGMELGATLVPSDHLDRTFPLTTFLITAPHSNSYEPAKTRPSYTKLHDGLAMLSLDVHMEGTNATGDRIVSCETFSYQWISDKFERRGACIAYDLIDYFRHPQGGGRVTIIDPATNTLMQNESAPRAGLFERLQDFAHKVLSPQTR